MKNKVLAAAAALSLVGDQAALAQDHDHGDRSDRGGRDGGQRPQGSEQHASQPSAQAAPGANAASRGWHGGGGTPAGGSSPAGQAATSQGGQTFSQSGRGGDRGSRWSGNNTGSLTSQGQGQGRWQGGGEGRNLQGGGENRAFQGGRGDSTGRWNGGDRGQWNGNDRGQWSGGDRGRWNDNRGQSNGDRNAWNGQRNGEHFNRGDWNGRSWQGQNYRRNYSAQRRFNAGSYYRPDGWYYRRWSYGQFLPNLFFSQNYWLNDYSYYGLSYPPPGCEWVRYGDDAILVDTDTGEIIQVVYGIFY